LTLDKIDKKNFYTGTVFLTLAVFAFSYLPMILRKLDYIFYFDNSQFKDFGLFLAIISLIFWLNCEGYFKKQVAIIALLGVFFAAAVGLNEIIAYP